MCVTSKLKFIAVKLHIIYMSNLQPLEVVSRGSETQLQVDRNVKFYNSAHQGLQNKFTRIVYEFDII